jgi:hypothetical protein
VHLIMVGYFWIMGALYFLGITRDNMHQRYEHESHLNLLAGYVLHTHLHTPNSHRAYKCVCRLGSGGMMLGATLWLVFILLLIYGLYANRAVFVLAHLITCVRACF